MGVVNALVGVALKISRALFITEPPFLVCYYPY